MRRFLIAALLGIAVLALLALLFRAPLALRALRAGAERNLSADPIAALEDGLHVGLCGAGGPLPDPVRSGPCTAIVAGGRLFVVDAGSGGARNLARMALPPGAVEAVFLTHFHSDHIDGLGELALQRWAGAARTTPLPVVGPTGVSEVTAGFDRAYRADARYRVAHHGAKTVPPGGAGTQSRPFETPREGAPVVVWRDTDAGDDPGGLRVTAFRVDHAPVDPAVGYRFDYAGRSVVVSGDTSRSEEVAREAEGVDLLVHEALAPQLVEAMREAAAAAGRENLEKILSDISGYHTAPVEAAEIAHEAGVGHLLFTHVVPPLAIPGLDAAFLAGVNAAFEGPVTLGRDGTFVSLPAGSDRIEVSNRL